MHRLSAQLCSYRVRACFQSRGTLECAPLARARADVRATFLRVSKPAALRWFYSFTTGPYVKKLCALSETLKDSSTAINRSILTSYDMEVFQSECRSILEQLQEKGMFSLAREVVALAELPVDNVVTQEVWYNELVILTS